MEHVDAIVIGMGPGGEVVADRLLTEGRRVAVVERELIGGECAYYACIPTKVLLRSPEAREEAAAAVVPKAAVTCPFCGATTTPDASGCCEFCGGAVNG